MIRSGTAAGRPPTGPAAALLTLLETIAGSATG